MRTVLLSVVMSSTLALAQPVEPRNVLALEASFRSDAEAGHSVQLSAFTGKRYILSFVYTSCPGSCPLTTAKLKRLDAALVREKVPLDVVVISLDPEHDTTEAVQRYRARYGLTQPSRFQVLVGDDAAVRTVTMLLGFRYARNAESGAIVHDNVIYLVGPDGTVTAQMSSLDDSLETFVAQVKAGH